MIRKMQTEDCEAVCELAQKSFPDAWSLRQFQELFRYETNYYVVAEAGDAICGFAGMSVSVDTADIMNIAVAEAYRRRGIGGQLLQSLMEEAMAHGCTQLMLEVRESNQPARMLYRHYGFEEIAIRKHYYRQPQEHGIVMRLIL